MSVAAMPRNQPPASKRQIQATTTHREKIAGGMTMLIARQVLNTWHACKSKSDFQTWLALNEMTARRIDKTNRTAKYGIPELAKLRGMTERKTSASLKRLIAIGAVCWSDTAILFADPDLGTDRPELSQTISRGGPFAAPRRMIRHLAKEGRPALVATALGLMLRCISRRRTGFQSQGNLKASWVAKTFDVHISRVKVARQELVDLGWIAAKERPRRVENRHGRAYEIDLQWGTTEATRCPELVPPPPPKLSRISTASVDLDPLSREIQKPNLDPATPGRPDGNGFYKVDGEQKQEPLKLIGLPDTDSSAAPNLDRLTPADLHDIGRVFVLHSQATARGIIGDSEADRLRFASLVSYATRIGTGNKPGLFASLLRGRKWAYITQDDEDHARSKMKRWNAEQNPRTTGALLGVAQRPRLTESQIEMMENDAVNSRRNEILNQLEGRRPVAPVTPVLPARKPMTADEMREWARSGLGKESATDTQAILC